MTFSKASPLSAVEIEQTAIDLLRNFYPDNLKRILPVDVEDFFDNCLEDDIGIAAIYRTLPEGCEGLIDGGRLRCYISDQLANHEDRDVNRRRFRATIAHELGHCYLHVGKHGEKLRGQRIFKDSVESSQSYFERREMETFEDPEWQAWRFAGAFLMPEGCFRLAVDHNWSKKQLKLGFDVNPSFVNERIRQLKIPKLIRNG